MELAETTFGKSSGAVTRGVVANPHACRRSRPLSSQRGKPLLQPFNLVCQPFNGARRESVSLDHDSPGSDRRQTTDVRKTSDNTHANGDRQSAAFWATSSLATAIDGTHLRYSSSQPSATIITPPLKRHEARGGSEGRAFTTSTVLTAPTEPQANEKGVSFRASELSAATLDYETSSTTGNLSRNASLTQTPHHQRQMPHFLTLAGGARRRSHSPSLASGAETPKTRAGDMSAQNGSHFGRREGSLLSSSLIKRFIGGLPFLRNKGYFRRSEISKYRQALTDNPFFETSRTGGNPEPYPYYRTEQHMKGQKSHAPPTVPRPTISDGDSDEESMFGSALRSNSESNLIELTTEEKNIIYTANMKMVGLA